jgi:hypothetical protein
MGETHAPLFWTGGVQNFDEAPTVITAKGKKNKYPSSPPAPFSIPQPLSSPRRTPLDSPEPHLHRPSPHSYSFDINTFLKP